MTVTFTWLKNINENLSDAQVLSVLDSNPLFDVESWVFFNQKLYPEKLLSDYSFDLPACIIDEIVKEIREFKILGYDKANNTYNFSDFKLDDAHYKILKSVF